MSIRTSRPRSGSKRDIVTKIQLELLHQGMTTNEAVEATRGAIRQPEADLRDWLKRLYDERAA